MQQLHIHVFRSSFNQCVVLNNVLVSQTYFAKVHRVYIILPHVIDYNCSQMYFLIIYWRLSNQIFMDICLSQIE